MEKFILGIMVGIVVYVVASIIIDAIVLFTNSLNKKQAGTLGAILNMILVVLAMHFRTYFVSAVGDVWFWVVVVCLFANIVISCVQVVLGMMSAEPY